METSLEVLGSVILDINDQQIDVRFLDDFGVVRDEYRLVKTLQPAAYPARITRAPFNGMRILTSSLLTNDVAQVGGALSVTQVNAPKSGQGSAVTSGPFIFYTPDIGYTGDDTFTYEIAEAGGLTSTGVVKVAVVIPPALASNITSIQPQPGPVAVVTGNGVPGRQFGIECSDDGGQTWTQVGTATVDNLGQFTYTAFQSRGSWGAQALGTFRLDENDNDYTLGDRLDLSAWASAVVCKGLSTSIRLAHSDWSNVSGADASLNPNMVPTADPSLRGGSRTDLGLGVNLLSTGGATKGHRLAAEVLLPIRQDLNGPQLETDLSFVIGWQKAW